MTAAQKLVGAWSTYTCKITGEEKKVFEEATSQLMGVKYEPVAVSKQVVSGMNYEFLANAELIVEPIEPAHYPVIMTIYQPLKGKPVIQHIQRLKQ